MLTHTKLGVAKIATIMIRYAVWIVKNATDTLKQALAIRALMGTGGEVHRWNFAKSTSDTLKINVTIAIGIAITMIVQSRRHNNSDKA
jgi:Na+/phosphate symporter